ncbi:MAG: glycosyltransferase [Actinomycetota bacterium]|nr:glycosyltransferase [Actinomycetota bacterium]
MHSISPSILHVSQPTEGGVCRCVRELVADQLDRGWQVAVASPGGVLEDAVRELGARHVQWRTGRAPGPATWFETARLRQVVWETRPDLVHLHSSKAGLAGRLAIRGRLPTIFQPHGWSFYPLHGPLRRAAVAWERLGAHLAHVVLCVSETERRRGEAAGIRANWHVVSNGVDVRELLPASDADRAAARRTLDLGEGPLIVCLGRICTAKGQDVLVEAWPRVTGGVPEAQLVLVGDGEDAERLRSTAGEGIVFAGQRDDATDWLTAADVVAAPSRWEGMSFAMLEAMASARSLVITDVPGARDALGDGAAGIVPLGDQRALAAAIIARLLDPGLAAAEGTAARARVERFHDIRDATRGVAELYAALLGALLPGAPDAEVAAAR